MSTPHQRAREIVEPLYEAELLRPGSGIERAIVEAIAAALQDEREAMLKNVYQAIHALHKGGTLEHCWSQGCECETIWKAVKTDLSSRKATG